MKKEKQTKKGYVKSVPKRKTVSKKSIEEVERAVNDISRPMRWKEAEEIAKGFVKACLDKWTALNKDLFATLKAISGGESLTYQTLLSRSRKKEFGFPFDVTIHKSKGGKSKPHTHIVQKKKDPTLPDIEGYLQQLSLYLRPDQLAAIRNLFDTYQKDFFNSPNPRDREGIFGKNIPRVYNDGYERAYQNLVDIAKKQGVELLQDFERVFIDPENLLIKAYYEKTYNLVTSKISIAARGEVLKAMAEGLANGDTWEDISELIFETVTTAYRYHWQRLVRTEMTIMYYEAFIERYGKMNAKYVQLSTSIGACPICVGLRGYYTLGKQPELTASTHPNCRCVYNPFFRLPKGAVLKG